MWQLTLYVVPRCPICSAAREAIGEFARDHPLEVVEVDISHDTDLWQKYKSEVPVLLVDGCEVARNHVTIKRLSRLYANHAAGRKPRELAAGRDFWSDAASHEA